MVARSEVPLVLVADAEIYICRVFEAKLTKNNQFRVGVATTGADALRAVLDARFDVILWDLRLRETFSVLPRIRALCPDATLLLLTTDDRPALSADTARLDVADVLVKPLHLDTLVERIRAALQSETPPSSDTQLDLARVGQQMTLLNADGSCTTRVLSSRQDSFMVVAPPRVTAPESFGEGVRVRVQVRGGDALYSFASRILRNHTEPVPLWELRMPRLIHREQRRKFPRYLAHLPVRLQPFETETNPAAGNVPRTPVPVPFTPTSEVASGMTEDIGQGGFAILSERPLAFGTSVRFDIQLGQGRVLEGTGKVTRLLPLVPVSTYANAPRYRIAVAIALNEKEQQNLQDFLTARDR